jgi:DNA-binding CsgD family transcriptional regulator/tetratricopeptide (TPR) repeat protein
MGVAPHFSCRSYPNLRSAIIDRVTLLERQEQLDALNRSLRDARADCGKLVLIAAEAGLGKSSLVEHFAAEHRRDVRTLWGACDALATPRALGPVHELAAQLPGAGIDSGAVLPSRERLFRALFEEFSRPERPCLAVLEDMHWADEATLDFVRFMGRRVQRTHALLILTYREDELPLTHPVRLALGELTGDQIIRLRLPPLSLTAVRELARDRGVDPGNLHRITGGNPFFVREALASAGEEGVPATVRDAVLARLMRCSRPTRELAEVVAMCPGRAAHWLLVGAVGADRDAIAEGVARGLLLDQADAVSFRHELARLAVVSSVPPERSRELHARLLKTLIAHGADLPQIVHHATFAEHVEALLEYAPAAGRQAARVGAHREAAAHFTAALRYSAAMPAPARAELYELHARECGVTNQTGRAIASAIHALELFRELGDIDSQSRLLSFLAPEYRTFGDKARADQCLVEATAVLDPVPHSAQLAVALHARARLASNRGQDRDAAEFGERALALARSFGDLETESHALNTLGSALLIAGDRSGYAPLEQSLQLALAHDLQECTARAYCNLVFAAVLEHDITRAISYLAAGIPYCEERALFSSVAYMRAYESRLALDRAAWSEAERIATQLWRSGTLLPLQLVPTLTTLALVRTRRDEPGAEELLEQALTLAAPMGEPERTGRAYAARAERAFYRGDLERLAQEATAGLEAVSGLRLPWIKGELSFWQSRVQPPPAILGDIAEPFRLMILGEWRDAARAWEAFGMPYEQALALLEGPEEALREALTILDHIGAAPLAAIARRRLRDRGARGVPRGPNEATRSNPAGLTGREAQILSLLVQGLSNTQLARRLHRSQKTIDHHVSSVLAKLGVHSRTEVRAAAIALGLLADTDQKTAPDVPG